MTRGRDAAALLLRELSSSADAKGCYITITETASERWASATFTGARHKIALSATQSPALDDWLAALPEFEFNVPGHLVADIAVTQSSSMGRMAQISLEALTVEAA